ncbi:MAG TPA: hypothetical protein VK988_14260 [Acidimicrobiales bacterium]|nr:hypothetical protein [Acidimicrobiales bacterium]
MASLVGELLNATAGTSVLTEVERAGGNPFLLTELVRALLEQGGVHVVDGRAELRAVPLPASFQRMVLRRLSFLSSAAMELLSLASVLGSTFRLRDLALVLRCSEVDLAPVVREAMASDVLADSGERLGFRHELVRDAIYHDIPLAVRKGLHTAVAHRLAAAGATAPQVAAHFATGASPGDTEAVEWVGRAAQEAAPHAPRVAAKLLAQAVEIGGPSLRDRVTLLTERASMLVTAGLLSEGDALGHR